MAEELVRIQDDLYVHYTSPRLDDRTRVLKHDDTFAVFDRFGDVEAVGPGGLGIYHRDTRFLSRLALRLGARRPLLLSSTVKEDNLTLAVDLANADDGSDDPLPMPGGTIHAFRSKVLWNATCHERLRLHNYGGSDAEVEIKVEFDADFADIFEVRGARRQHRGTRLPNEVTRNELLFTYRGMDERVRRSRIRFDPAPDRLEGNEAHFKARLGPREEATLRWSVHCELEGPASAGVPPTGPASEPAAARYEEAVEEAARALSLARVREPRVYASNEQFNDLLNRSVADLHMMRTDTRFGPYPYAGVPWFNTAFGRDGLVTAFECLWFSPDVARGVLHYLAATQADADDASREAQPGKVLHETRDGEMAAMGEVPFDRYYGTVDATPLFVMLAAAYYERTGDLAFTETLWPHVERALSWVDRYGDPDGDGFVEYAERTPGGLVHQGWKDSRDAVFHEDGRPAEPPIALCEVQGYVHAAQLGAASLAEALGRGERAGPLREQAERLRRRFEEAFWCEDLGTYALALDGDKRPCRVRASNAGHCLFAGIADPGRARRVAQTLTGAASYSGWGVRTVAASEVGYSPISYHNGSVWPHDNALIAAGFGRYGLKQAAAQILAGLVDASLFLDLHRLPELFCGFHRRPGEGPTLYPVSCAPQSWASGAPLLALGACLGLRIVAAERTVEFTTPYLPPFLQHLYVYGLRVGEASVDLYLVRHEDDVGVNVLRRDGDVNVVILK